MLKPPDALLESDTRFRDFVFHSAETGERRPMCIDDLRSMVASIELTGHVPPAIREQFDVARNAFIYSWFVYEFATLAEQQCFAILEMALRHRLDPATPPNATRSPFARRPPKPIYRLLHEIVILRVKTWIREETRRGLREAEEWRRERVRFHFEVLEHFREEQRRRRAGAS
jgi:hypothetical protein